MRWFLPIVAVWAVSAAGAETVSAPLTPVDLAKPFATRSPWRLVATQGSATVDYGDNPAPGAIQLCLEKAPTGPCAPALTLPPQTGGADPGWEPHYLDVAQPVYPRGPSAPPLLLIRTSSMHAGDGGQLVVTQLLKYNRPSDQFVSVYSHSTGTNNNEEDRFVTAGPLEGSVISEEPTPRAPFVYWVTVSRLSPSYAYKQVLRYQSATHYADGNPLAVIDSEMPDIEQRLGLWRPGLPLPLPAGPCPKPHLVRAELWCQ